MGQAQTEAKLIERQHHKALMQITKRACIVSKLPHIVYVCPEPVLVRIIILLSSSVERLTSFLFSYRGCERLVYSGLAVRGCVAGRVRVWVQPDDRRHRLGLGWCWQLARGGHGSTARPAARDDAVAAAVAALAPAVSTLRATAVAPARQRAAQAPPIARHAPLQKHTFLASVPHASPEPVWVNSNFFSRKKRKKLAL